MTDQDDIYYIDLVRNGDQGAYSYLVERYSDMVYSLALKILKNESEAEDLAQEIFIATFKSLSKFKGNCKFSTWLYRITYNKAISFIRKTKREWVTENEQFLESHSPFEFQQVEPSDMEQNVSLVQKAIKGLSEADQLLVMLHYFESQSIEEIAKVTQLSVSNVKVKLFRIRKKLKEELEMHHKVLIPIIN